MVLIFGVKCWKSGNVHSLKGDVNENEGEW
jgi:hypothetical protein